MQIARPKSLWTQALHPPVLQAKYEQLRVAIVSDAISGRNGVGTYYADLVQYLRPNVEAVELIAPHTEANADEWFSLPMPGDSTQRLAWPRSNSLYERLDLLRPNLVVLPTIGAYSFFGLRYARKRKLPIAIVHHTNFEHLLSLYWRRTFTYPTRVALSCLNRWLCRHANAVATMNVESLQEATRAGAKHVRVMGTPLPTDFLRVPTTPVKDSIQELLFVGRLAPEKGLDSLLAAATALSHLRFTIVGDGPLRGKIEHSIATLPNTRCLGWQERSVVRELLDACQMLVLPSKFETFGTVALEALARQRFVATTEDCGISKWPDLSCGLFKVNSRDLPSSIEHITKMPAAERERVARQGWQAVRTFNEHTIRGWLKFLVDASTIHH